MAVPAQIHPGLCHRSDYTLGILWWLARSHHTAEQLSIQAMQSSLMCDTGSNVRKVEVMIRWKCNMFRHSSTNDIGGAMPPEFPINTFVCLLQTHYSAACACNYGNR